ncbi:hypothetical protein D9619_010007 [Psilocybe cf. subviscida]|uniref:Uncharacterized protein n=1 Tax=Psilocybe cf. subviscida TaxID=2480587 RepID=A0A8H5F6F2_9AGAR|nr:hypothetical protein D9619_010007 [Psilocybe cf. subviscida]
MDIHWFKTHVENFATRRSELQSAIAVYIAGGVDQANLAINEVSRKLDTLESKLDDFFQALMRKLDTPQEKEAFRFFDQNNGVENCVSKDDLLDRLLTMAGDVLPESEDKAGPKADERILKSRKVLTDEVRQNFEESLEQNTLHFKRILAIQNNNHEQVIAQLQKQDGYHNVTISKLDKLSCYLDPDTKLSDPEVKRIWERMGLKTSVKAKTFVLTFRDHYQPYDHSAPPTSKPLTSVLTPPFMRRVIEVDEALSNSDWAASNFTGPFKGTYECSPALEITQIMYFYDFSVQIHTKRYIK